MCVRGFRASSESALQNPVSADVVKLNAAVAKLSSVGGQSDFAYANMTFTHVKLYFIFATL